MFASLQHRNYRIYFTGALVSNIGTWIQRVAQAWLVLELSHGSAVAVGIFEDLDRIAAVSDARAFLIRPARFVGGVGVFDR